MREQRRGSVCVWVCEACGAMRSVRVCVRVCAVYKCAARRGACARRACSMSQAEERCCMSPCVQLQAEESRVLVQRNAAQNGGRRRKANQVAVLHHEPTAALRGRHTRARAAAARRFRVRARRGVYVCMGSLLQLQSARRNGEGIEGARTNTQ